MQNQPKVIALLASQPQRLSFL